MCTFIPVCVDFQRPAGLGALVMILQIQGVLVKEKKNKQISELIIGIGLRRKAIEGHCSDASI